MVDLRLTGGSPDGTTTLETLCKYMPEFIDKFPKNYVPEIVHLAKDNSLWIKNPVEIHTMTEIQKVTYIVANKHGDILNRGAGYVQLPKEGYIGRYVSENLGANGEDFQQIESGRLGKYDIITPKPTYWIDINEIRITEVINGDTSNENYTFESIPANALPTKIQHDFFSKDETMAAVCRDYFN